jgi:hypothetical protein
MRHITPIPVLLALLIAGSSCRKETSVEEAGFRLDIRFRTVAGGSPIRYGDTCYTPQGEVYRPTLFRIYLGNFSLTDESGTLASFPDTYHLLDAGDSASLMVRLHADARPFRRIAFQVGVDSIRNVSGAQTGALDPLYGMFWTWNTGYINVRMEGLSPSANTSDGRFEYHIGGFRTGESTRRAIILDLPAGQAHALDASGHSEARIDIDLDRWFRSVHNLPIAGGARVTAPGPEAVRHADNCARMFTLTSIAKR